MSRTSKPKERKTAWPSKPARLEMSSVVFLYLVAIFLAGCSPPLSPPSVVFGPVSGALSTDKTAEHEVELESGKYYLIQTTQDD
ncbi:MAG: hypothetical protein MJA83_12245, partial [Gammaproteobacteria bacterium]|nr:hypothetical protein [Gammaproteobacteria bacterium]